MYWWPMVGLQLLLLMFISFLCLLSVFCLLFLVDSFAIYMYFLNPNGLCFLGLPNFLVVVHTEIVDVGSL